MHRIGVNALCKISTDGASIGLCRVGSQNAEALMIKKGNLAARLMDVYQKGFDTLTRSRTAGKQTITVKQVHVTGGQNIIADKLTTRGHKGGG